MHKVSQATHYKGGDAAEGRRTPLDHSPLLIYIIRFSKGMEGGIWFGNGGKGGGDGGRPVGETKQHPWCPDLYHDILDFAPK